MKRFQFKLQPLLSYRRYLERLAQQETAKAQVDVKNCTRQIQELEQAYEGQSRGLESSLEDGITSAQFRKYCDYMTAVENQIMVESQKKIQLKKILKEKVNHLKKKSVDKKAMEIYREKLKTVYQQESNKIEQKELDEISSIKSARKISNGSV